MRHEYSTTGARMQEALRGQGLSIGSFLSGRDYQIRFGAGWCRGGWVNPKSRMQSGPQEGVMSLAIHIRSSPRNG
jgi:hypothetical protein